MFEVKHQIAISIRKQINTVSKLSDDVHIPALRFILIQLFYYLDIVN